MVEEKLYLTNMEPKASCFFRVTYTDKNSRGLSAQYDIETCPNKPVPSSLDSSGSEEFAYRFLMISRIRGEFVGVDKEDLEAYAGQISPQSGKAIVKSFIERSLLILVEVESLETLLGAKVKTFSEVLFPTAGLLDCQKVERFNKKV
ncbi:MAG: hypothetical protein ABIH72_01140 [archaeon]